MSEEYHIRAVKDYAVSLLELLKKDGAIEDLELHDLELTEEQKAGIQKELDMIAGSEDYLKEWDEVRNGLLK